MELKVTGKTIDTAPIKHLLRQGEANVDIMSLLRWSPPPTSLP